MPGGLFSWGKSRFLRRGRTPERAVHVVLPPEPTPRHVRFDDWDAPESGRPNVSGVGPGGGGVGPAERAATLAGNERTAPAPRDRNDDRMTASDWRYGDVRVQIAPLARPEDMETRDRRAMSAPRNPPPPVSNGRSEYAPISKMHHAPPPALYEDDDSNRSHLSEVNVVFLQRNDERGRPPQVKRTMLPADVRTMRQVHSAFCRAFNLNMQYLQQPHVRIYIQEPRGQLFYELEDPMDIRDKSVLRLKEGLRAPSPTRLEGPRTDYFSDRDDVMSSSLTSSLAARPASAMAAFSPPSPFGPPKPMFDAKYDPYDPYASDTASSHDSRSITRSGSATPVIDRETRVRMDTMERQLAGLSTLVHSALKGMDETSVRDMEILRRQVLNLQSTDIRAPSEEPPSLPDSSVSQNSERTHAQLAQLRERVQQTSTEMRQLRRVAQVNAQNSRELIKSTGDQIMKLLAERLGRRAESVIPSRAADVRKSEHSRQLTDLLEDLTSFERSVEEVRSSVLNSNRKLRMSEVERLTTNLTEIGRNAASIKTAIPEIHTAAETELLHDVERVRAERTEAVTVVDQSLRRCKALANIMVTMKKLAMVQDPSISRSKSSSLPSAPSPVPSTASTVNGPHSLTVPPPSPSMGIRLPLPPPTNGHSEPSPPPPVPPSPTHYQSPSYSLDGVLREVNATPPPIAAIAPNSHPTGQPPRPPSRFSVKDARQRMPTVMGTATVIPAAPSPSPTIISTASTVIDTEGEARRQRLEERQAVLAEKQRQLHTQFEQLQSLAPN